MVIQRQYKFPHLLSSLPLGQLTQPLLASPHTGVDDLEEELASPGVEDEDGPVDWLGGQVALEGLVDGDTVHIGVIHKPDDLVAEQLSIVLHMDPGTQQPWCGVKGRHMMHTNAQ